MKKIIQKLFGTTKQAIISTACILAVLALAGAGTAYAAGRNTAEKKTSQVFESTVSTQAITADEAKAAALADAGLASDEVTFTKTELDYDNGMIVYEMEFYTDSAEYEYEVNANTGAIYSKSKETYVTSQDTGNSSSAELDAAAETTSASASTAGTETTTAQVTLEEAKEIALADAGVSSADVTFTKEKQDHENGALVYDLEFYSASGEWEYEIRISDGTIVSKSTKEYVASSSGSATASDAYISVDEAKEIALTEAGLSSSDVTFKKAKLDKDDGIMVYELEFYSGRTEYEVKINASTGAVVEYEADID